MPSFTGLTLSLPLKKIHCLHACPDLWMHAFVVLGTRAHGLSNPTVMQHHALARAHALMVASHGMCLVVGCSSEPTWHWQGDLTTRCAPPCRRSKGTLLARGWVLRCDQHASLGWLVEDALG